MNFVLKPSLQHIALVKIAVLLWNENDVRSLIAIHRFSDLYSREEWKTIENRVIEKVQHLSLPKLLKEKVLGCVKPTGLQILEWMEFHCLSFGLHLTLPAGFCWTPQGTIDKKKTARVLIKDNLDISTKYKLACIYCLEKDIIYFWNNMPEDLKKSYWNKFPIIRFWSNNMKREEVDHISYKNEFYKCAHWDAKVATEYFLQKLTPRERKEVLVGTAKFVGDADALCFLLSQMDEEQQMKVFKNNPRGVLECFLEFPWQSFFIRIANCMWDFISKKDCANILTKIIDKVLDGYKDWNYQKLFSEFWQEIPNAFKSFIIDKIGKRRLLLFLLCFKDKENFNLILKEILTVKEKFIYSDKMNTFLEHCIRNNKWDFLDLFIRECLASKNEMLKFKHKFEKRLMCPYFKEHFATKKHKWDQLFHLSDGPIFNCDKICVEGVESCSSKWFQSLCDWI